ncbi:MAG: flagellar basal body L-ring protein FlgH [Deltaproteobacteria bacterium]|nr:flagellar basal body L-ring protein FlgH [Deltaproteobacteria bacterium]
MNYHRKMLMLMIVVLVLFLQTGCAGLVPGQIEQDRSVDNAMPFEEELVTPQPYSQVRNPHQGSLWVDGSSRSFLFGDNKAMSVDDIVTVRISEVADASRNATTSLKRNGSMKSNIAKFFGSDLTFGLDNLWGKNTGADTYAARTKDPFAPDIETDSENDFNGTGSTSRKDKLIATISARVVRVYPNGNMFIKGKREVNINNEKQFIFLSGLVRPEDVSPNNVILSSNIAEAKISLSGKGVIADKQKPGYGHRLFDVLWPF